MADAVAWTVAGPTRENDEGTLSCIGVGAGVADVAGAGVRIGVGNPVTGSLPEDCCAVTTGVSAEDEAAEVAGAAGPFLFCSSARRA